MRNLPMPVGKVKYFEGDILLLNKLFNNNENSFPLWGCGAFFVVEITTPENLHIPILLTRIKVNNQTITLAPLGKWNDVVFSEEMFNALYKFGYKFRVLRGYLFEKEFIFRDYVDTLYEIKSKSEKLILCI